MMRRSSSSTSEPTARRRGSSALGPRGREIFSRLFGDRTRAAAPVAEAATIAIASGKGGTGKSFLSTSLAVLFHRAGKRITVVDCDFGLACDHLLLGVNPKLTLRHLLCGQGKLEEIRIETPAGPALLPGGSGIRQMANLSDTELLTFGKCLGKLAATEDLILLDMGAGISPQTILTLTSADHVVLVTQPEIAALTDAYAVCKNLTQLRSDARISVVVNRVMEPGQGRQAFDKLASVMQKFTGLQLTFLGEIAEDPAVTQRRLGQMPIVATDPDAKIAREVAAIAERLEATAGPLESRPVENGNGLEARFTEQRLFL
ncbi:MAG: P-loop NTPase [Planctomycetes bacterium]|nr:P-loop NTPase [Planctomycetota bacterium]